LCRYTNTTRLILIRFPEPNNNAAIDRRGANKRHDDERPFTIQPSDANESVRINNRLPNADGDDKHHLTDVSIARTSSELICSTRYQRDEIIVDHLLRLSHFEMKSSISVVGLIATTP
jgi:hypothetical protein